MNKIIKENLCYLRSIIHWCVWWVITTTNIVVLIIISYVLPKAFWDFFVKISCKIMMYCALLFPIIKGYDIKKFPFPVIFVANHVSFFDLFISGSVLPGNPRGVELYSHFFTPIYGWFITRFGQISIEVGNKSSLKKALILTLKILKDKERNIYIAPEGTRTKNGEIGEFRNGAFYLSIKSGKPIIPVVYKKLFERNNKNSFLIRPGFFDVIFLPPVYPKNFQSERQMKKFIKEEMDKTLGE
jgi:1-acyl-sn-glycerol-3-phosphate acyltransferase